MKMSLMKVAVLGFTILANGELWIDAAWCQPQAAAVVLVPLDQAKARYEATLADKVGADRAQYLAQLQATKTDLVLKGKVEAALEVQDEIRRVTPVDPGIMVKAKVAAIAAWQSTKAGTARGYAASSNWVKTQWSKL